LDCRDDWCGFCGRAWQISRGTQIGAKPVIAKPVMAKPFMAKPVMEKPVMAKPVMAHIFFNYQALIDWHPGKVC
jgi:hypothetical protein